MATKNQNEDQTVITIQEKDLAECLGVSDRRVRQMVKEEIVFKVKAGQYDLIRSVKGYIEMLKSQEKNKNDTLEKLKLSKEAETLMHEKLRKRKTELQVLHLEKNMHTSEDVEMYWNAMILTAKSKITAIPTKVAPSLAIIEDAKEIQSILKREISEVLNELANYDVDSFESVYDDMDDEE